MPRGSKVGALFATVLGASVTVAAVSPAWAQPGAQVTVANNIILLLQLPPDDYSQLRSSFGSYMYDSVIPRPHTRVTVNGAPVPIVAPISARAFALVPANTHVADCANRYRSYSPATDTYVGFDGAAHRCVSP